MDQYKINKIPNVALSKTFFIIVRLHPANHLLTRLFRTTEGLPRLWLESRASWAKDIRGEGRGSEAGSRALDAGNGLSRVDRGGGVR